MQQNQKECETIVRIVSHQKLIGELLRKYIDELDGYKAIYVDSHFKNNLPFSQQQPQDTEVDITIIDVPRIDFDTQNSLETLLIAESHTKHLALTGSGINSVLMDLIAKGLCGSIMYSTPLKSLRSILDLIMVGEKFMPDGFHDFGKNIGNPLSENLTDNELNMLRFLSEGLSNKEIARQIGKSEVSVKLYMSKLFAKIGARSRTHAMVMAYREGFR